MAREQGRTLPCLVTWSLCWQCPGKSHTVQHPRSDRHSDPYNTTRAQPSSFCKSGMAFWAAGSKSRGFSACQSQQSSTCACLRHCLRIAGLGRQLCSLGRQDAKCCPCQSASEACAEALWQLQESLWARPAARRDDPARASRSLQTR